MNQTGYLIIAIVIIAALVALFIVTFVINRKTPVPEGCENIKITEEGCANCQIEECAVKVKLDIKKIEEELKEDK
ncbi:MAG: hypothetical protein IKP12_02700 [Acholeplasmatales bacterium]|nr:hypothetical protein [Acholeplasmatales bacterium]